MKMEKRKFRIGELAEHLSVERFVIRFWEKEFNFKAHRSVGGQRFYDEQDLKKFQAIKELLYEKKFTIAGAKKQIFKKGADVNLNSIVASHKTSFDSHKKQHPLAVDQNGALSQAVVHKLRSLRKSLILLQKHLS